MKNITIITDSCANLTKEYLDKYHIKTIPMYYRFDDEVYEDGDLSNKKSFYENLRNNKIPKTICSKLDVIEDAFTSELDKENDIIYICFSSALSSSYFNSTIIGNELKKEYPDRKIHIIDSLTGSLGEGIMAIKAKRLVDEGNCFEEIVDVLEQDKNLYQSEFMINDLKYLKMGGRLNSSAAIIGGILNIKVLVHTNDLGEVSTIEKCRGEKFALKRLASRVVEMADFDYPIGIATADNLEYANRLKNEINELKTIKELIVADLTSSIGSHLGADSVGVAYKKKK